MKFEKETTSLSEVEVQSAEPPLRWRVLAACVVALIFGCLTNATLAVRGPGIYASDFTYPWLAARAVAEGVDPYAAIRASKTPWEPVLFYPLPAAIVTLPVAWLPVRAAAAVFLGLSCGLLAFFATKRGMWRLIMFASAPACQVVWSPQWYPLLTAAALCPPALGLLATKPNLALPLLAFQTRRRAIWHAIAGGAALMVVSLVLQPAWPARWVNTLATHPLAGQYQLPILTPIGAFVGLAALRWRLPEARLLLGMACIPQNTFFYEQFPLLLVPRSRREMLAAVLASQMAYLYAGIYGVRAPSLAALSERQMPLMVLAFYLPALIMVLRRPNVSAEPAG